MTRLRAGMGRRFGWGGGFVLGAVLLGIGLSPSSRLEAGPITGLQVFGDSLGDEYSQQSYSYARNWVEQVEQHRNINLGRERDWGFPREFGFEFNWAIYGATSLDLLVGAALYAQQVVAPIRSGRVSHAVLAIGANDFFPRTAEAYGRIYNGSWSQQQIDDYIDSVAGNIETLLNIIESEGVPVVLANIPDYGITPYTRSGFPDPAKRELVAAQLVVMNERIRQIAEAHKVPYADIYGLAKTAFGTHLAPNPTMLVGNRSISMTTAGTPATNAFVNDAIHPHTVVQGVLANLFLAALNEGYDTNVPLFTEQEILSHAGLSYGGRPTLPFDVNDYVINYVPEPSSWALAALAACGAPVVLRRRRAAWRAPTSLAPS